MLRSALGGCCCCCCWLLAAAGTRSAGPGRGLSSCASSCVLSVCPVHLTRACQHACVLKAQHVCPFWCALAGCRVLLFLGTTGTAEARLHRPKQGSMLHKRLRQPWAAAWTKPGLRLPGAPPQQARRPCAQPRSWEACRMPWSSCGAACVCRCRQGWAQLHAFPQLWGAATRGRLYMQGGCPRRLQEAAHRQTGGRTCPPGHASR